MALVIGGIIALLSLAVAVYPFLRSRFFGEAGGAESAEVAVESVVGETLAEDELEEIYRAIGTLRLERELGNIPEGLYREQLNGYRIRAAQALRDRQLAEGDDENWALEEEIRVARSGLYGSSENRFPCPNCGRPVLGDLAECPECGAAVSRPSAGAVPPSGVEDEN